MYTVCISTYLNKKCDNMVKMNLNNDGKVVKQENKSSALSECRTEQEVIDFIAEMNGKLDNDGNIFVMESKKDLGEVEQFMKEVLQSDEVLPKEVFNFGTKNLNEINPETNIEGFEFVEFTDNKIENKAMLNFLYYGSQHMNQIRKAQKLLKRMKTDYYKVYNGETTLTDYLGIE